MLTAEPHAFLTREVRHLGADVTAEQVLERAAIAQACNHPVESGLQLPHLAAVVDGNVGVEIVALHLRERAADRAQRFAH